MVENEPKSRLLLWGTRGSRRTEHQSAARQGHQVAPFRVSGPPNTPLGNSDKVEANAFLGSPLSIKTLHSARVGRGVHTAGFQGHCLLLTHPRCPQFCCHSTGSPGGGQRGEGDESKAMYTERRAPASVPSPINHRVGDRTNLVGSMRVKLFELRTSVRQAPF